MYINDPTSDIFPDYQLSAQSASTVDDRYGSLEGCIQRFRIHKPMFLFALSINVDI